MSNEQSTIKIWKSTRRLAKILAAHYGITVVELLHRLVLDEIKRKELPIE